MENADAQSHHSKASHASKVSKVSRTSHKSEVPSQQPTSPSKITLNESEIQSIKSRYVPILKDN